jgi:hypothetical protein
MTCVNCSNTIENALLSEYSVKGLKTVQIALLTHKMKVIFSMKGYIEHKMSPDLIKDEVEMVGFGAEFISK